jgi:two-component system OmpR family sensor kinase
VPVSRDVREETTAPAPVTHAPSWWPTFSRWLFRTGVTRWPERGSWPHSLRVRLALWYGVLLALVLAAFGGAVYGLTASSAQESVDAQVKAEARVAMSDLNARLQPVPPYWPAQLSLPAVDTIAEPEIVVEVFDVQGHVRYRSNAGQVQDIALPAGGLAATGSNSPIWYEARMDGERMRAEALAIMPPDAAVQRDGPIGTLVVAKSVATTSAELAALQTFLLVAGIVALFAALGGGWAIAARVLAPLSDVADTAGTVAAATARGTRIGSLSSRVRRPRGEDELVHLVDAFNTMLAALESASAAQRRFVADASHELRAPLTTIQGNLALLLSRDAEIGAEERRAMLDDAQAETLRLTKLVNELLALARADAGPDGAAGGTDQRPLAEAAGHVQRPRRLVDLDRVVLELVRQTRARLTAEGSPLEVKIEHLEPVRLRGDEQGLHQLGLILLDNAIKYAPARERAAHVSVSLERRDEGEAVLRVRDSGIGIDAADLPHIFERFYRSDRARDRQGTGLGLSIARAIAEQHEGSITVESAVGRGSTFTVHLPAPPIT